MAETNISLECETAQPRKTFVLSPKNTSVRGLALSATAEILEFPACADREICGESYLSPDEARRVIDASGRTGRQRERDRLLLTMMYRHGLRVSEAVESALDRFRPRCAAGPSVLRAAVEGQQGMRPIPWSLIRRAP